MSGFSLAPDDPGFDDAYGQMIEHERDRAIAELEAMVVAHPASVAAWAMMTRAYQRCLDGRALVTAARRVVALDPTHDDGLHHLAFGLMASGDTEAAVEAYRRAAQVTGSRMASGILAVLLHRLGRFEESWAAYRALLASTAPGSMAIVPVLRGAMALHRDWGRPLAADRHAHMLLNAFRLNPALVGSSLAERDQTTTFHEWLALVDKAHLGAVLRRTAAADPGGRTPESFELPAERAAFEAFAAGLPAGTLYIVKPARGSGGQGISLTADAAGAAARTGVVVQRYIANPYLVDGRKGHIRVYLLVAQARPLRAYVYTEGIVRFAPEPYDPAPERLADISMHVTNTALHLGHPSLNVSQDRNRDDEGSIWSLTGLLRRMAADGIDPAQVQDRIAALAEWFLRGLEREGQFARQAAAGPPRGFAPKLLGLDVLLDAEAQPWLIEMQSNPAARGSPLVQRINSELFATAYAMGIGVFADDALSAADLEALRTDPAALEAAELALERQEMGRFRALFT